MTGIIAIVVIAYVGYEICKLIFGALFDFIFKDFKK